MGFFDITKNDSKEKQSNTLTNFFTKETTPIQEQPKTFLKNEAISMPLGDTSAVRGSFLREPRERIKSFFKPKDEVKFSKLASEEEKAIKAGTATPLIIAGKKVAVAPVNPLSVVSKDLIETPERLIRGVGDFFNKPTEEERAKRRENVYRVNTYSDYKDIMKNDIEAGGVNKNVSEFMSNYYAGSVAFLDATVVLAPLASALKSASTRYAPKVAPEVFDAWVRNGMPKNLEEAVRNRNVLQKSVHPDLTGGSDAGSVLVNKDLEVLRKNGVPNVPKTNKIAETIRNSIQKVQDVFNTPISELDKIRLTPTAQDIVPTTEGVPGLKKLPGTQEVPGQAPAFGLSIRETADVGKQGGKKGFFDVSNEPVKPTQVAETPRGEAKVTEVVKDTETSLTSLINEAKKYNSGSDFYEFSGREINQQLRKMGIIGKEQVSKYWEGVVGETQKQLEGAMQHRPTRTGAFASDISQEASDMGIPDFYEHPEWYHHGGKEYDESVSSLMKIKDKPDATIRIYRATPKDQLRTGDWVTLSAEKARLESLAEGTKVHSFKVKAKDVEFAGDDITEFGYWGDEIKSKLEKEEISMKIADKDTVPDRTLEQISDDLEKTFGRRVEIQTVIDPVELGNKQAVGAVVDGIIKLLLRNNKLSQVIANHEGWHWFKRQLSEIEKKELSAIEKEILTLDPKQTEEIRKLYTKEDGRVPPDSVVAEELMADEFARYQRTGKTLFEKLKIFFDKALQKLKILFGNKGEILKAFRDVKKTLARSTGPVQKDLKPAFKLKPQESDIPKTGPRDLGQAEKVARDVGNYDDFVATLRGGDDAVLPFYEEGVETIVTNPNFDKVIYEIKQEGYPSLERFYNDAKAKKIETLKAKRLSTIISDYTEKYQNRKNIETITNRGKLSEKYLSDILSEDKVIEAKKIRVTPANKIPLPANIVALEEELVQYDYLISEGEERLLSHPGKALRKFESRKEGQFLDPKNIDRAKTQAEKQALIEQQDKLYKASEKAFEGTAFSDQYDNPDIIREQISDYKDQVKRLDTLKIERKDKRNAYRQMKKMYLTEERDRLAIQSIVSKEERLKALTEVEAILRKEGRDRRRKIESIRDFFYITDGELKDIIGPVDFRLISDKEFETLLDKIQKEAYAIQEKSVAKAEVEYTIYQNELKRVENLQEAEGLGRDLSKLTTEQLIKFNDLLTNFHKGDVFLGTREIETLQKNTDLPNVKTQRQILEQYIAKRTNVPIEEIKKIVVEDLDKFRSATNLAQQNAFFQVMVEDAFQAKLQADINFVRIEHETQKLIKAARRSRKRSLGRAILEKIVPTDELIVEYLEEPTPEVKSDIAKTMSKEELELAHYIQNKYQEMRDYLVSKKMLNGIRENYYTHRRRGFLEVWLKGGTPAGFEYRSNLQKIADKFVSPFFRALKETIWDTHKLDEAFFKILNSKTGEILPLEKFFQYSLQRSGNLIPTKNVATAFLGYVKTFETKRALDNYMPKIEASARAIAPSETTEKGVLLDDSLERFVKEWVNTQKGRPIDLGVLIPGGIIDSSIRMGIAFTRFLYLSFRFSIQTAAPFGEQTATLINIGLKNWAKGVARSATKQGMSIAKKYEGFTGKTIWDNLTDQSKDLGSRFVQIAFIGFSKATRDANVVHLLGSMTPEEFRTGDISIERLAQLKKDIGRWRADDLLKSIVGATSPGQAVRQFKSWAIPVVAQTIQNLKVLGKMVAQKDFKGLVKSKEAGELFRAISLSIILLVAFGGAYKELKNKKNRTMVEEFMFRMIGDALSFTAALNVTKISNVVLVSWVTSTIKALATMAKALALDEKTAEGKIKGVEEVKKNFIPKAVLGKKASKEESTIDTILSEQTQESKQKAEEAQKEYEKLKKIAETSKDEANAEYTKLPEDIQSRVSDLIETEKLNLTDTEKRMRSLGVENGNRARYIYSKAMLLETKEEKNAYIKDLMDKKIVSDKVLEQVTQMVKEDAPVYEVDQKTSKEEVLNTVVTYAKAIGTDPVTAFARIFTGQKIRRVDSGAIIVERMSYEKSQAFKKKRDADTTALKLDHTIPLQLGGSNTRNNLELVPTSEWEKYTPVENYLGNLLRSGKIKKKEAQSLIAQFKKGEITFEDIKQITS